MANLFVGGSYDYGYHHLGKGWKKAVSLKNLNQKKTIREIREIRAKKTFQRNNLSCTNPANLNHYYPRIARHRTQPSPLPKPLMLNKK